MKPDRKNILVAEDNPALAAVLRFNLQQAGYEATVAKNGLQALQAAKATEFDFVITDQQMPLMKGTELCEQLRLLSNYKETPIIMLTAKAFELKSEEVQSKWNVCEIFPKPFSPSTIVEAVDAWFAPIS